MKKIGVFLCWCGSNIASVVNVDQVLEKIKNHPSVTHAEYYKYFCSEPGQAIVEKTIKEKGLEGIVIAACSPSMHENTFRKAATRAGLNRYQVEIANIREQCSWVHKMEKEKATEKAIQIIDATIEKLKQNQELSPTYSKISTKALVVGAGIAGMQAAIDIANSGFEVILVEKEPSIGGHMAQLSETFPTLDCSQCIMTPKMVELAQHPKIKLYNYSEVEEVSGYIGNFKVKIKRKASFVDNKKCTGCGICTEKCPVKVASEFDRGIGQRKAIYVLSPQAVPNKPVIDAEHCRFLTAGKCKVCEKFCETGAIDYEQKEKIIEEEVGAIVVATGYDLYSKTNLPEYGAGQIKDVIDGIQFERLNSASGPTEGEIKRPSDGKVPKEIVFVQCSGSRDPEHAMPYCSKICCMYTAKHAMLYKHKVLDGRAYVFYIDIRAGGKGYEEFVMRGIEEERTIYFRGKVSKIFQEGDKVVVYGADLLTNKQIEIKADMVVLATAIIPKIGAKEIGKKLNISTDQHGFYNEAHIKMRPVESKTMGIFLAGCGHSPKDIPDAVTQAGCAASKVIALFSEGKLMNDPMIAWVDEEACVGCGMCVDACPYQAREIDPNKNIATVKEELCQGCGTCVAICPNKACQMKNNTTDQVLSMIEAME